MRDGHGNIAASCADVGHPQRLSAHGAMHDRGSSFDDEFGLGTGNQARWRHHKTETPELALANDVRRGFKALTAGDPFRKPWLELWRNGFALVQQDVRSIPFQNRA